MGETEITSGNFRRSSQTKNLDQDLLCLWIPGYFETKILPPADLSYEYKYFHIQT